MEDCESMATPMITNLKKNDASYLELVDPKIYKQLVGSLMYLVNAILDICFDVNTLSQFMVDPRQVHWIIKNHFLRYLRGTLEYGLRYLGGDGVELQGYKDLDWEGSVVDKKSTSGCCFSLGSIVITSFSRKHTFVSLSSIEAEYMAVSMAICESIFLRKLLINLFSQELQPMVIYFDNQSYIKLSDNPVIHVRYKHIDIIYHFIWDRIQKGAMKLQYISTDE
jgi:hypothetical protein